MVQVEQRFSWPASRLHCRMWVASLYVHFITIISQPARDRGNKIIKRIDLLVHATSTQEIGRIQIPTDFVTTVHCNGEMLLIIYVHQVSSTSQFNLIVAPTNQPMQPNEATVIYSKCTSNQVTVNNKQQLPITTSRIDKRPYLAIFFHQSSADHHLSYPW